MTDATAKYILTAEDQTKSAIASVKAGFNTLDKTVRETTRSLTLMSELFIGARILSGIKRFTESVLTAAEKSNKDFAGAIGNVKASFGALLVPKGGLPEATEKMKELADTLQNPAVLAAADSLTSTLVIGFAKVAKFTGEIVAGLGLIINGPAKLSEKIDIRQQDLLDEKKRLIQSAGGEQNLKFAPVMAARVAQINAEFAANSARYIEARKAEGAADEAARMAAAELAKTRQAAFNARADKALIDYRLKESMAQVEANGKYLEDLKKTNEEAEKLTRTITEKQAQDYRDFFTALNLLRSKDLITAKEYAERSAAYLEDVLPEIELKSKHMFEEHKKAVDDMSEFTKQAARNMQDAFATFLFDPYTGGLKGMLVGFINTLRQMIAQAAAAKIFSALGGGGGGWFGKILGGILGAWAGGGVGAEGAPNPGGGGAGFGAHFATGGAFTVGGSGGADSQPVSFMATPGERVSIERPADSAGARGIVVNYNVDARGATADLAAALPEILRRHGEAVKMDIVDGLRRGRYPV